MNLLLDITVFFIIDSSLIENHLVRPRRRAGKWAGDKPMMRLLISIKGTMALRFTAYAKSVDRFLMHGIFRAEDFVEPVCIGPLNELVARTAYFANRRLLDRGPRVILYILCVWILRLLRWPFYNAPKMPKPPPEEYFRASQLMTRLGLQELKKRHDGN